MQSVQSTEVQYVSLLFNSCRWQLMLHRYLKAAHCVTYFQLQITATFLCAYNFVRSHLAIDICLPVRLSVCQTRVL